MNARASATSAKGTASEEELKKVVDKLTNCYDIEKLKLLTQVNLSNITWDFMTKRNTE